MADVPDEQHGIEDDASKLLILRRISLIVDVLLICGCVYLLASDIVEALDGRPEHTLRGGAFLVNLSATFALVYRSMALLQRFGSAASARTGRRALKCVLALVLPLLVATGIELMVHGGHRAQLDALVQEISARVANSLTTNAQVLAADLITLHGPYLHELTVRTDTGEFVLSARVPGFDADGFAAHYSSTERIWHLEPVGSPAKTAPAFDANGPVLMCRLEGKSLHCERREP